ncbi:MAG TPA: hypothetical protein VGE66_11345 [Chitinophagaceae bacterium]
MHFSTALKRNLLLLFGFMIAFTLHSAPAAASLPLASVPATAAPVIKVEKKKGAFFSLKKIRQAVKNYILFAKSLRKKYQNDAIGSTILIALLLAIGLGAIIYLLSYLSVSGIVITAAGIVGFALIVIWAWRRIRWNAQY